MFIHCKLCNLSFIDIAAPALLLNLGAHIEIAHSDAHEYRKQILDALAQMEVK